MIEEASAPEEPEEIEIKEIWFYDDIHKALRKAALQAVVPLKPQPTEIQWDGPLLTMRDLLCGVYNNDERLSAQGLEGTHDRGQDALDAVLMVAFNLGMEQGVRNRVSNVRGDLRSVERHLQNLRHSFAYLQRTVTKI